MATATAPAKDRHAPQPRLRADQLPAENPSAKNKPKAKNKPNKDEGKLFSVFIILVVGIAAIGFVVLAQRNAIIKYSLEAEALQDRIAESEVAQNNLQSQLAIMAASPQLQRTAIEDLEMASAENVSFIQADRRVTSAELEAALVFLDSQRAEILAYRDVVALEATAKLAAVEATDVEVEGTEPLEGQTLAEAGEEVGSEPPAAHLLPVVEPTPTPTASAQYVNVASGE